jgi:hypothetical protein
MMKTLAILLCLSVCPFFLSAETVMVSIGEEGLAGGGDGAYRYCFSALESGIMDKFFLAGHIVFNDEGFRSSPDRQGTIRRALEGGAVFVLFVDCLYEPPALSVKTDLERAPVAAPQKIVISFIKTENQDGIWKGEFAPPPPDRADPLSIEEYYAHLGGRVADYVLSEW